MVFSAILKQLREEKHLSQKDVAAYLGMTRQAVAAYEIGKREPDYEVLKKLADYFGVSVDYLLGRSINKNVDAFIIGKNIELIRGHLTYKELSEDIYKKTGELIQHDLLESYEKGEKIPFIGTNKILSKYAGVSESFLYLHNSLEDLENERELYLREKKLAEEYKGFESMIIALSYMDRELVMWMLDKENIPFIKLTREIQKLGISIDSFNHIVEAVKSGKSKDI